MAAGLAPIIKSQSDRENISPVPARSQGTAAAVWPRRPRPQTRRKNHEETLTCRRDGRRVLNIYSWNDEFRTRLEAVYPEVDHTSDDGTVTYLKDGTEIHWVINPNQDGVYQQKLDEALLNQATAAADDKIDIFLSETDYVYK